MSVSRVQYSLDRGSEEGSYVKLIDFVSLNSRLESNEEEEAVPGEGSGYLGRLVGSGVLEEEPPEPYTLHPKPQTSNPEP